MKDIIQLLPDVVANQIAAGEVIQRPASVVKELVENAVDAGATTINLILVDAGRTSIQVLDNGQGMSETDARLAFERHATSKIRQAEDLFALRTMGFRGEALASIAAVAQVELYTKRTEDELGTHLSLAGSKVIGQEACACPTGSNFIVENLFYNVPARRRFLKSNSTELNHIVSAFERIALVYPEINLTLRNNESELFSLRPGGLKQRIVDIFGKRMSQDLLPIDVDTTMCKISGFVGKPESAKKKGTQQYFFVNGRFMKHPYFHKAVMNAFERLIHQGDQIPYFIYFNVNPQDIDVNIHPTKTEIKFENEQAIWQIVFAAVREAIGLFNDVPAIDFDTEGQPEIPVFTANTAHSYMPKIDYDKQYNPFQPQIHSPKNQVEDWDKLFAGVDVVPENKDIFDQTTKSVESTESIISEKSPIHYQYKGQYIMTAVKSGLMVIEQHRAHIRILYEQYLRQLNEQKKYSQKVLFPEVIELSVSERLVFDQIIPELKSLGFDFSPMGKNDFAIQSVPAGIDGLKMADLVHSLLVSPQEHEGNAMNEVHHSLAYRMAVNAAIPVGQVLNNDEMEDLVNNLFCCENSHYTPDGKAILFILKQQEMEYMLDK